MNSPLLALETSGTRCSVALWRGATPSPQVTHAFHDGAQTHAERLIPIVNSLLSEAGLVPADLGAIAFGQGPGSFTGLRVACAVAQGMGMALSIPLIPIVGLDAVADQVSRREGAQLVWVAMDARMNEVYARAYVLDPRPAESAPRALCPPVLLAASDLPRWMAQQHAQWADQGAPSLGAYTGDAWDAYPESVIGMDPRWAAVSVVRPEATAIARLGVLARAEGKTIDAADAAPLYVRDKVAFTTAEREAGSGGNPRAMSSSTETRP